MPFQLVCIKYHPDDFDSIISFSNDAIAFCSVKTSCFAGNNVFAGLALKLYHDFLRASCKAFPFFYFIFLFLNLGLKC